MKNKYWLLLVFTIGVGAGWLISLIPGQQQVVENNVLPGAVVIENSVVEKSSVAALDVSFDAASKFVELMTGSGFAMNLNYREAWNQLDVAQRTALDTQLQRYVDNLIANKQADPDITSKLSKQLSKLIGNESTDKYLREKLVALYKESKQYQKALTVLMELQHLAQFSDEHAVIEAKIQQVIDMNIADLKQHNSEALNQFFTFLIEQFPTQYDYRWRFAKYAYDNHEYQQAVYLMQDLRYVPEYSQQVAKLTENINFRLNNSVSDGVVVELAKRGESYFVGAIMNEYEPVNLLIDTGASMTVISPELAYSLGVLEQEPEQFMKFQTANGEVVAPLVKLTQLKIGSYSVDNLVVGVLPFSDNSQIQGLLGMNFLKNFKFFIDQQNLQLELLAQP